MRKHKVLCVLGVLCLIFALSSCGGTFVRDSYRALSIAGNGYQAGMKAANAMHREGTITDEQMNEIDELAQDFYDAYHASVDATAAYEKTNQASDKDRAVVAIQEFTPIATRLAALLLRYGIKVELIKE